MATVTAPYPALTSGLLGPSLASMAVSGQYVDFYNNDEQLMAHLLVRNPPLSYSPAITRIGSFDYPYRDVIVKDWYRTNNRPVKLADPVTVPSGTSTSCVAWSPDGRYLALGNSSSPYLFVYKRDGNTFTKLADSTILPGSAPTSISWSPDGKYLLISGLAHDLYSRTGDTITELGTQTSTSDNPSIFLPNVPTSINQRGMTWSPDGMYMAITLQVSPWAVIYKRNGTMPTFTKLLDLPGAVGNARIGAWSKDSRYFAIATSPASYPAMNSVPQVFKRDGDFFRKMAVTPTTNSDMEAKSIAWSPTTDYFVVGTYQGLTVYSRAGDDFSRVGYTLSPMGGLSYGVAFSPDGRYVARAIGSSPYLEIYKFTNGTLKLMPNLDSPTGVALVAEFSPRGDYLAIGHQTAPRMAIYKGSGGPISGAATRINPNAVTPG